MNPFHAILPPHPVAGLLLPAQPRQRILTAALALVRQRGPQAVTMGGLATSLGMSKKTVYKWFSSKAALLGAVMNLYTTSFRQELDRQSTSSRTAVEELLILYSWVEQEPAYMCGPLLYGLKRRFPAGWELWQNRCRTLLNNHIRNNLRWGMHQGFYHPDLPVESLSRLGLLEMSLGRGANLPPAGARELMEGQPPLTNFMMGIVTPAGALLVRRLQETRPDTHGHCFLALS